MGAQPRSAVGGSLGLLRSDTRLGTRTPPALAQPALVGRDWPALRRPASLRDAGAEVVYAPVDVRSRTDMTGLVDLAKKRFGRLDALVNNAGIMPISPLDDLRVDDW